MWQAEYELYGDIWQLRTPAALYDESAHPSSTIHSASPARRRRCAEKAPSAMVPGGMGPVYASDPIEFLSHDLNLFRYGRSNPLRYIDPLGLQTEPPPPDNV